MIQVLSPVHEDIFLKRHKAESLRRFAQQHIAEALERAAVAEAEAAQLDARADALQASLPAPAEPSEFTRNRCVAWCASRSFTPPRLCNCGCAPREGEE